jgi:hypothetical protein
MKSYPSLHISFRTFPGLIRGIWYDQRQQTIRWYLKRISMSVGYRSHDVTGSDIALGANHG